MNVTQINGNLLSFEKYLTKEEKRSATIQKYLRDVRYFLLFTAKRLLSKELAIAYKEHLCENYAPASVNSMLASLNCYLRFKGREDCCVKALKVQRQMFSQEEKELSVDEYKRLVKAADGMRLSYVMRTICGTGIRVSELRYITAEAIRAGRATVNCKGKTRIIFIPLDVRKMLLEYMKENGITSGAVFITKNGRFLDRSNIWRDMRSLCKLAGVSPKKVFPHNLRHLFARIFYSIDKDIVRLADLLGHSSINTTRIYTMECGRQHIIALNRLQKHLTT